MKDRPELERLRVTAVRELPRVTRHAAQKRAARRPWAWRDADGRRSDPRVRPRRLELAVPSWWGTRGPAARTAERIKNRTHISLHTADTAYASKILL
jgi:hypothetical protein